jgi:hypothetical protein
MAGFGSEYSGLPWGGASSEEGVEIGVSETLTQTEQATTLQATDLFVSDTITCTELVGATSLVRVMGAVAIMITRVKVTFDQPLDSGYAPNTDPSNYTIPGLTVFGAALDVGGTFVTLTTSTQSASSYIVTVTAARTVGGDTLNPAATTATFFGFSASPYFYATAQSRTRVAVKFSQQPLVNSSLTDPSSYRVWDLNYQEVPVLGAEVTGPSPYMRVQLTLGAELDALGYYVVWVGPQVETQTGRTYYPDTYVVQWGEEQALLRGPGPIDLPFEAFSGEVEGGFLGSPAGQVFFSPALEVAAGGSEIEVESVECCTQAYDKYQIPPSIPLMGIPLSTWAPTAVHSVISGIHQLGNRTWAPFPDFGDAALNVGDHRADTKAAPVDGRAVAVLTEVLDPIQDQWVLDYRACWRAK